MPGEFRILAYIRHWHGDARPMRIRSSPLFHDFMCFPSGGLFHAAIEKRIYPCQSRVLMPRMSTVQSEVTC